MLSVPTSLMQAATLSAPSGTILASCGKPLEREGEECAYTRRVPHGLLLSAPLSSRTLVRV